MIADEQWRHYEPMEKVGRVTIGNGDHFSPSTKGRIEELINTAVALKRRIIWSMRKTRDRTPACRSDPRKG